MGTVRTDRDLYREIRASPLYMPGELENAFQYARSRDGRTSFEILADAPLADWGGRIVDLAAGTGPMAQVCSRNMSAQSELLVVDFDVEELNLARHKLQSKNITFKAEAAQNLSVESNSVDLIFCHLGVMALCPLEPALAEVRRILKQGGKFIFNVLSANFENRISRLYFELCQEHEKLIPGFQGWGDPRAGSQQDFGAVLINYGGFSTPDFCPYSVFYRARAEAIFENLKSFFQIHYLLPEDAREALRGEFMAMVGELHASDDIVEFELPFFRGIVTKLG